MNLDKAYKKMAKAMPLLNNVTVTITTTEPVKDGPFTKAGAPVAIVTDHPAKVSKGNLSAGQQKEYLTDGYDAKLIISKGVRIPAGCSIIATDHSGQVTKYKRASRGYSGYQSHQEVAMVLDEKA